MLISCFRAVSLEHKNVNLWAFNFHRYKNIYTVSEQKT